MSTKYRPVLAEFKKDGYNHKTLQRQGNIAILEKTRGDFTGYEVVLIQRHEGYEMMGQVVPPSEFYPRSEDWGVKGFSFPTLEQAKARFDLLVDLGSKNSELLPEKPKLRLKIQLRKI